MRGLMDEEREVMALASNGDCSMCTEANLNRWFSLHEHVERIERRGLIVRLPCNSEACDFGTHAHVTSTGRLALQCDQLGRSTFVP